MFIWWLDHSACEAIGSELPEHYPCYIKDQYTSRRGRSGRGRLWIDVLEFGEEPIKIEWPDTSFARWLGTSFGGIAIREWDVKTLMNQAGIITDLLLNVRQQ